MASPVSFPICFYVLTIESLQNSFTLCSPEGIKQFQEINFTGRTAFYPVILITVFLSNALTADII